jgi:farnesyl-diphosphate farnesyltransferase
MTLVTLVHAVDCLIYLSVLRDQSVFNFCAIPQVMAIATLALVYRNPAVFQRNIKIRRGESCQVSPPITNTNPSY